MIAAVSVVYMILAMAAAVVLKQTEEREVWLYRVEINRIAQELNAADIENNGNVKQGIIEIDMESIQQKVTCIKAVSFLKAEALPEEVEKFYEPVNGLQFEVCPVLEAEEVKGYLRFDYEKHWNPVKYIGTVEVFIALMYLILLFVLLYIYNGIIKPFHRLSAMPYELSKGNLQDTISEQKGRYFGKFVWGIGMLKESLEAHKKKELKLEKDKKMMVLSVSHDVKTPLNAINLYAKALEQGLYDTDEKRKEAVIKIQEKCSEINAFIKEIVKSQEEDILAIEVKESEYYLKELADKVLAGYQEKCALCKMQFQMGTYENRLLKGDIDRMYEAVGNLLENAFKYGDGRSIAIYFTEEEGCELIHVYNSGIPVMDTEIPHLFDSFFRGSNVDGKQGNGLGLYICSEIMKKQGGDIYAKAEKDGMEFVLVCQNS